MKRKGGPKNFLPPNNKVPTNLFSSQTCVCVCVCVYVCLFSFDNDDGVACGVSLVLYATEQLNGQLPSTLAPSNMQMVKQR